LPCPTVAITHKVKVAGQRTLYITVHDHEQPAEIFLRVKGSDCSAELIRLYMANLTDKQERLFKNIWWM
jgi:hypothetical protein